MDIPEGGALGYIVEYSPIDDDVPVTWFDEKYTQDYLYFPRSSEYPAEAETLYAFAVPTSYEDIYEVVQVNVKNESDTPGDHWANYIHNESYTQGAWIETSYSGAYRDYYAGTGYYYSSDQDRFSPNLDPLNEG